MTTFPRFHAKHGPAFECQAVSETQCEQYRGKLPDALIEEWRQHGWCGYQDGFLWTVNPEDLDHIFEEGSGRFAFLRTAFGGVFYWDGQRAYKFDTLLGTSTTVFSKMSSLFDSLLCDDSYLEDSLDYDLFQEAMSEHGKLNRDECYGFLPPIPMGGPGTSDTLKRVKLREHLAIVAQLLK